MRHELAVASAQVKTALMLAGLQADGHDRDRRARAESRPHRADAGRARRAGRRSTAARVRVSAGAPEPFELDVPGRPVVGRVLRGRGARSRPVPISRSRTCACNPTRLGLRRRAARAWARDIEVEPTGSACGEPVGDLARASDARCTATTIAGDEVPNVRRGSGARGRGRVRRRRHRGPRRGRARGEGEQPHRHAAAGARRSSASRSRRAPTGSRSAAASPRAAALKSHGDHRIAMAAAVAANAVDGESTVRGMAGGRVVVPRVRRRPRPV